MGVGRSICIVCQFLSELLEFYAGLLKGHCFREIGEFDAMLTEQLALTSLQSAEIHVLGQVIIVEIGRSHFQTAGCEGGTGIPGEIDGRSLRHCTFYKRGKGSGLRIKTAQGRD